MHMAPACLKEGRHGLIVPAAAAAWGGLYALPVQLSCLSGQRLVRLLLCEGWTLCDWYGRQAWQQGMVWRQICQRPRAARYCVASAFLYRIARGRMVDEWITKWRLCVHLCTLQCCLKSAKGLCYGCGCCQCASAVPVAGILLVMLATSCPQQVLAPSATQLCSAYATAV